MNIYGVSIPIAGFAYIEVEAETEEAAIAEAFEKITIDHIEEWDCHKAITKGNVFYGSLNALKVEEL